MQRPLSVSVDEIIIPFTGSSVLRQFCPHKPTPNGLKVYVLVAPDGLILDFEFHQGKEQLIQSVARADLRLRGLNNLSIGEAAVLRFVKSLPQGASFYFDRFFTTPCLLEMMSNFGMGATSTIKKNLVPKPCKFKTERQLKSFGRGTSECLIQDDSRISVTVCYDKKQIFLASNKHGIEPTSHARDGVRRLNSM